MSRGTTWPAAEDCLAQTLFLARAGGKPARSPHLAYAASSTGHGKAHGQAPLLAGGGPLLQLLPPPPPATLIYLWPYVHTLALLS